MPKDVGGEFHRERIRNPSDFKKNAMRGGGTFRTKKPKEGLNLIIGIPKGKEKTDIQSILCKKDLFSKKECSEIAKKIKNKWENALFNINVQFCFWNNVIQ